MVQEKLHGEKGMGVVEPEAETTGHKRTLSGSVKEGESEGKGEGDYDDSDGDDSDDDDAADVVDGISKPAIHEAEKKERETHLARNVLRHWMRVTGIKSAGLVDDGEGTGEQAVPDWTRGIAPKLEGRIIIEGGGDEVK